MSKRTVTLTDVGDITLVKRRGTKNMRLSITASGQVRVSLPHWVPYALGLNFAKSRQEWIQRHQRSNPTAKLVDGARIGKSYRLRLKKVETSRLSVIVRDGVVLVSTNLTLSDKKVQAKATLGCYRALGLEANRLLPQRLSTLADRHGYDYKNVAVRKLTSRWGSCSSDKKITLSYFLIQLPWHLIDYVLLHELVHTRHLDHSPRFWDEMKSVLPDTVALRKEIRQHKPRLKPLI